MLHRLTTEEVAVVEVPVPEWVLVSAPEPEWELLVVMVGHTPKVG
jgi:hypothetical protein